MAAGSYSYAQQAAGPGGLKLSIDVGAGVTVDDNAKLSDPSPGTTFRSDANLGVRGSSETRTQKLEFGISADVRYDNDPNGGGETDVRPPKATLTYSRTGADSRFDLSGRYSRERVDDTVLTFVDENFNPVDLIFNNGELQRLSLRGSLSTGIEAPLGFDLGVTYDRRDYIDTFDPDLYDRTSLRVNGTARLRFSDVLLGRVTASYGRFEADDLAQTEELTTTLGTGVTYTLSRATEFSADVDFTRIETTEFGSTDETTGVAFNLGATQTMPNGTLSGNLTRTISKVSERTEIGFDRSMELPRGSLSYGLGYSIADSGDNALVARASIRQEMRDGALTATLTQSTTTSDDDEDLLLTRVSVGYDYNINETSGLNLDFGLGRTAGIGGGAGDTTTRADLTVTYRREIARDVDWSVGYRARFLDESAGDTATSNAIFTRIDRSFSIRP